MSNEPSTTDRVIAPLRESRRPLYDGLGQVHVAAGAVDAAEQRVALAALAAALAYLQDELLPACRAEEATLFIAVEGALAAVYSTRVMKAQHASIGAMAADLAQVVDAARADGDVAAYRRYLLPLLYGLYALVRAHLEAEDDAYLSLLDEHLSESQVGMIVDNMRRMISGGTKTK